MRFGSPEAAWGSMMIRGSKRQRMAGSGRRGMRNDNG